MLLLGFALTQTNGRISQLDDRISRLEDKVDTGFARIDERFTAQDVRLNEINLKLTALIAALNATAEVEAALEGRLLDPNTTPADEPAKLTPTRDHAAEPTVRRLSRKRDENKKSVSFSTLGDDLSGRIGTREQFRANHLCRQACALYLDRP